MSEGKENYSNKKMHQWDKIIWPPIITNYLHKPCNKKTVPKSFFFFLNFIQAHFLSMDSNFKLQMNITEINGSILLCV